MGTNFYFFSKNKSLMSERFPSEIFKNGRRDEGFSLVDEPEFGYEVHICKLSFGWLPLFEHHSKAFTTFDELENFYVKNKECLRIFDEYCEEYTWEAFKELIIQHGGRKREPAKWVYEEPAWGGDGQKSLYVKPCKESKDADLYTPFRHDEYFKTEMAARQKFKVWGYTMYDESIVNDYYCDDKHKVDWAYGTFS